MRTGMDECVLGEPRDPPRHNAGAVRAVTVAVAGALVIPDGVEPGKHAAPRPVHG